MFAPRLANTLLPSLIVFLVLFAVLPAWAQFGVVTRVVPTSTGGPAFMGASGGLSSDGATLVVGGYGSDGYFGAAWVYTRANAVWNAQGVKLSASDFNGNGRVGSAAAISGDANTVALGGPADNSSVGAAWIFARAGGPWTQQANKLVGTGAVGAAHQGFSVALSADGNTLAEGAPYDNGNAGAVWVFTRTGSTWTQQGSKLVGTGEVGPGDQGYSVALSADGNTLVDGSATDNGGVGAVWVFTRSGGTWTQQGTKLVGTGAIGAPQQGLSVAISADGKTLAEGGNADNSQMGATWVFTRNGSSWSQQGGKLVGTGWATPAWQGFATALSSDGNLLLVGAPADRTGDGSVWVFRRMAGAWSQLGDRMAPADSSVSPAQLGAFVAISSDGNTLAGGAPSADGDVGTTWIFARPAPSIVSVTDVPNDQGGAVSVRWNASVLDGTPNNAVTSYGIWRQVPPASATRPAGVAALRAGQLRTTSTVGGATFYWEQVGSAAARGFAGYSFTAPTASDSVAGSNPRTLFMVDTEQSTIGRFWPSDPDSGYSVDNLGPLQPAGAAGTYASGATQLFWNPNTEPDLGGYRVYRGAPSTFPISPSSLVATLGSGTTNYLDPAGKSYIYKLTAVDVHGNESAPTTVVPGGVTAVDDIPPGTLALAAPRPNPAAAETAIRFALPADERATLDLFDAAGQRVATLVDGPLAAGEHVVRWSPRAQTPAVDAGVYFLRLTAGGRAVVRRLAIIG